MAKRAVTSSPFTIIIDTSEQKPWHFRGISGKSGEGQIMVKTVWQSMGTGNGDYGIVGAFNSDGTPRVSIERKSLSDLYGTILSRRPNFVKELENLQEMEFAAVVVEANFGDVMDYHPSHWDDMGYDIDRRAGIQRSVLGSIYAWQFRYPNIRWWFLPRRYAATVAYRMLDRFYQEKIV